MSIPRPVPIIVPRKAMRAMANRGVKIRVNTGAMFSITLCFASTSQEATITAPRIAHGSQSSNTGSKSIPIAPNIPAAQRDQCVVDEQLAGEANEVHATGGLPPPSSRVGNSHRQPQSDRQVQGREHLRVTAALERI